MTTIEWLRSCASDYDNVMSGAGEKFEQAADELELYEGMKEGVQTRIADLEKENEKFRVALARICVGGPVSNPHAIADEALGWLSSKAKWDIIRAASKGAPEW